MTTVEILSAEAAGADRADAEAVRIVLQDDELIGYGAARTVRVRAADVRTIVWLDQPRTRSLLRSGNGPLAWFRDLLGLVVVLGDHGPLMAFYVHDFAPVHGGDGRSHLRSSGVEELAAALGVVVEGPSQPLRRSDVASVLVGHRTWHTTRLLATPLVVAAGVAGFAAAPGAGSWWGAPSLLLSVALCAVVLGWLFRAQARLLHATGSAPGADGEVTYPDLPDSSPLRSRLELGATTVTVWSGWRLSRRRGPVHRGGIVRCEVGPDHTRLIDDRGHTQLVLETRELVPDEAAVAALTAACDRVGIRVQRVPEEPEKLGALRIQPWTFDSAARPEHGLDPVEDGAVSLLASTLLVVALATQALGGIVLAAEGSTVGWVGLAMTTVLAGGLLATHLRFTALRRRTEQANPRQVPAPRLDWWRSRIGGPGGGRVVYRPTPQEPR